jgi:putative YhdH/YhfP family quinone oxidoreductase
MLCPYYKAKLEENKMIKTYRALVIEEQKDKYIRTIQEKNISDLPKGDLLIKVEYSSLNYKDALSATGNKGITKAYPHTPGIDAVGIVEHSKSDLFSEGDKVIVTGNDLGMNTPGGFGEYIRVPAHWVLPLPTIISTQDAMSIGTAGLTAGSMVQKIVNQIKPEDGDIIVSGATGGVGSISVAILSDLGYKVTAVTGKDKYNNFLKDLGASDVINRNDIQVANNRPMLKGKWAAAVDTVGGTMLENIIKSTQPFGIVTCCGNVAGAELNLTVFPFILRGITISGVSSQNLPNSEKRLVWNKFANEWDLTKIKSLTNIITLDELNDEIDLILKGGQIGRKVLRL